MALTFTGNQGSQSVGHEWCEEDDFTNSYWDINSRRTYEPPGIREAPVKKAEEINSGNYRDICYYRYKLAEENAVKAANNGNMLESYYQFTAAAAGRKHFSKVFYGNTPDHGHYCKYHCNVGSAWIQRERYENDIIEEQITQEYERGQAVPRKFNAFWARKEMSIREKRHLIFAKLMEAHINKN